MVYTIGMLQAAFCFAIPVFTSTNNRVALAYICGVLCLHLIGSYFVSMALKHAKLNRSWRVPLYMLIPLGNIVCMVELSKVVNAKMNAIGATRGMSIASVKAIEAEIQESPR